MLRVVVAALLLAAATLATVDLADLVGAVYTMSSSLERFTPTYVFEIDGCNVLVYVVNSTMENSPLLTAERNYPVFYPRNMTPRPLTSVELEKLLDALFQALGPSAEAEYVVRTNSTLWWTNIRPEVLHVEARNVTQLVEEVRKAVKADFYLSATDAIEALERGAEQVAFLYQVKWRGRDLVAAFQHLMIASLEVKTVNLSAAVETLKKAREAAGELWNNVGVGLWYGPYFVPADTAIALTEATWRLEDELGNVWEFIDEEGRVRRVWGFVNIVVNEVGPVYVVFPYPNGTMPDRATAERLVRRFVELSSFCKSPLVVEFWPRPEFKPPSMEHSQPLWPYVAAVGAALAVAVGLLVLVRRRK